MSVLIKGMEMPTSCWQCFARTDVNIGVGIADGCALLKEMISNLNERLDECPLVPVPPHGDLIDQDEYRDEFMAGVYDLCNDDPDNYRANAIIDLFDDAPTIIPAEEAKNGV